MEPIVDGRRNHLLILPYAVWHKNEKANDTICVFHKLLLWNNARVERAIKKAEVKKEKKTGCSQQSEAAAAAASQR